MEVSFETGRLRKDFSKIKRIIDIPNLIDIQNRSFERFLQADVVPEKREFLAPTRQQLAVGSAQPRLTEGAKAEHGSRIHGQLRSG